MHIYWKDSRITCVTRYKLRSYVLHSEVRWTQARDETCEGLPEKNHCTERAHIQLPSTIPHVERGETKRVLTALGPISRSKGQVQVATKPLPLTESGR
jgi:hypothetical protein